MMPLLSNPPKEQKKKIGRPKKVDTEKLVVRPKHVPAIIKAEKVKFDESLFWDWMLECTAILEEGWELKTIPNKHWIEIVRFNGTQQMPFAFVDRKNGNIHCPALMHGEPHSHVRGNISDPETRLACITPLGAIAYWPWQPTHQDYSLHNKSFDFTAFSVNIEHNAKVDESKNGRFDS